MIRFSILIGSFLTLLGVIQAQQSTVVLTGTNKTYAGRTIEVHSFTDLISNNLKLLDSIIVDNQGNFKLQFTIEETQLVSLPLGIFQSIIYLEPGCHYEVVLPDYQAKTKSDLFNPFFKPIEIYLGIKNIDSLNINYQIASFNEVYQGYVDKNYTYIFQNPLKANIDSVIEKMEQPFSKNENSYFRNYRKYKYAWLKYSTIMRDSRYLTREYFNNQPVLYNNTAYMDLFNQVFANFLNFYSNTSEGQRIFSDIAYAKSPTYTYQTFENNMVLINDTLQEMVLLKGLHDAFYTNDFPVASLILTLDSIACCAKVPYHKQIASNIKQKVLLGKSGFKSPPFELYNSNGILVKSSELLTNYVYLNFISIESFPCREDLELLKALYEKHKADFNIVSICIDDNLEMAQKYFNDNGYKWLLLGYGNQKNILESYKVKSFPAYYLIGPDGNLLMSPANSPNENFEWYFFQLLQSKIRNQNRNR